MNPLLIAGPGRSGTTWLAEVVDRLTPTRLVFEPFHPRKVRAARRWSDLGLVPGERSDPLYAYWCQVLSGRAPGRWVRHLDHGHPHPAWLVVKTIWTLVMLEWVMDRFAQLPLVLIVRDPRATIASRIRRRWIGINRFHRLIAQPPIRGSLDGDALRAIRAIRNDTGYHAAVWAIETSFGLRAAERPGALLVRYEDLVADGNGEIRRIAETLGIPFRSLSTAELQQPSRLAGWPPGRTPESAVEAWRSELAADQQEAVELIVGAFGLKRFLAEEALA